MSTGKNQAEENLFRNYKEKHYLGWVFSKVRLPSFWRGVLVAIIAYLVFVIMAALSDWNAVIKSSLHLFQINFSITILLGIWFGDTAITDIKSWLQFTRDALDISTDDYTNFVKTSIRRLGSKWLNLFALMFIIPGVTIALLLASNAPNEMFPFSGYSAAFIYVGIVELGIVMLHLLGGTGIWLGYWFTKSTEYLSNIGSVDYDRVDKDSVGYLADIILKLFVFLFIIIASVMPSLAYVSLKFQNTRLWAIIFVLCLPSSTLALSYLFPTYHLHRMLVEAKNRQLFRLKRQKVVCEKALEAMVLCIQDERNKSKKDEMQNLLNLIKHFQEELNNAEKRSVWPFNLTSIARLVGSSFLPILTFFLQELLSTMFR